MGSKQHEESMDYIYGRKVIRVHCKNCGWINEDTTEFLNIEEDIQGADVMTFRCKCGEKGRSRRIG